MGGPPPSGHGWRRPRVLLAVFAAGLVLDVDLLLADRVADLLFLTDRFGLQADAFDGDGLLCDHGTFFVQDDLAVLLADLAGPAEFAVAIHALGNRFAGHVDLFVTDRHGDLLFLRDHVLAQPDATR